MTLVQVGLGQPIWALVLCSLCMPSCLTPPGQPTRSQAQVGVEETDPVAETGTRNTDSTVLATQAFPETTEQSGQAEVRLDWYVVPPPVFPSATSYPHSCAVSVVSESRLESVTVSAIDSHRWQFQDSMCNGVAPEHLSGPSWQEFVAHAHQAMHPVFVHQFLRSLDQLPADHEVNSPNLYVTVRYQLSRVSGQITLSIVRSSGVELFDVGALEALVAASLPAIQVSSSGMQSDFDFEWTLFRHPTFACTEHFMRPMATPESPSSVTRPRLRNL